MKTKKALRWTRRFRTFWCVIDNRGTAYLFSARTRRSKSIAVFLADVDKVMRDWPWWRRIGYSCQRCDIKVRSSQKERSRK